MQFRITWTDAKHGQESLAFSEEVPDAKSPAPSAVIFGRRFYLQSSNCHDDSVMQRVNELQSYVFANFEQFTNSLQANSPLQSEQIAIQSDLGERKFLEKTIPGIEGVRMLNQQLLARNPYFLTNSVYPGQMHPLHVALSHRNHALLKDLCNNPYLLLINEKVQIALPNGSQLSVSPLEYAIINDDLESVKIILSAAALNRPVLFPRAALKQLGPEKASPYFKAYVKSKQNIIETPYLKSDFEELRKDGFLDKDINRLKSYYTINAFRYQELTLPVIASGILQLLHHSCISDEFKGLDKSIQEMIDHPLTNFDAQLDTVSTLKVSVLARILLICSSAIDSKYACPHLENKPYVKEILVNLLKNAPYTIDDSLFRWLETLPKELFEMIPQEKIDAYKRIRDLPSGLTSTTKAAWASRHNLVTLLGKIRHTTSMLTSPHQAHQWRETTTLDGGNTAKVFQYFCSHLKAQIGRFNKDLSLAAFVILDQFPSYVMLKRESSIVEGKLVRRLDDNEMNRQFVHELTEKINHSKDFPYIKLGTPGHTQSLLFWSDYFIVCDRRLIHDAAHKRVDGTSIKIYTQPKKILEEEVRTLLDGSDASSDLLKKLQEENYHGAKLLHEILLKPQKHSNCSWASDIAPAIQVIFQLFINHHTLLKDGKFDEEVLSEMNHFNHFAKSVAIHDYVYTHQAALAESPGMPDAELTGKAFFYTLYKCAMKEGDEHYLTALDKLVYSGFAISSSQLQEYSPEEKEKMHRFLEQRYELKGIKDHFKEIGYLHMENKSDAEAFLFYLGSPLPSSSPWPQYLLT